MGKVALRASLVRYQAARGRRYPLITEERQRRRWTDDDVTLFSGQMELAEHLFVATCSCQLHLRTTPDHYSNRLLTSYVGPLSILWYQRPKPLLGNDKGPLHLKRGDPREKH